jgi:DNA-directed RNA polymerase specialized sigma24 family protein
VIVQRCVAAMKGSPEAEDVAQDVKLRLWKELQAGNTYSVPFRVVVHKVIDWTLKDHWSGRPTDVPLPEGWGPGQDDDAIGPLIVRELLDELPPREREVWELHCLGGLGPEQIAERLAVTRNNVDQALHRGRQKLRDRLANG